MAFGFHAVRTALEQHPRRVERVLVARDLRDARARRLIAMAREANVPFQPSPREALDRLAGGLQHQGFAARLAGADLLAEQELLDQLGPQSVTLVLDSVQDPRNLGAILRTAGALGVDGVFLPGHRAAGLSPAAIRTAAGGLEFLKIARAGNLSRLLEMLAEKGLQLIALDERAGRPPWEAPLASGVVLVAGGEEKGVRPAVLARCPVRVWVPLRPESGSLNVSVAVGMVLGEMVRQHITKASHQVNA
jgi:23S rRNA (guanosine2251-2'-O)-methyltransferase